MLETQVPSLDQEDPLLKGKATHSSILAWEIPRTEEPIGYNPYGCERVRHDLTTKQQQLGITIWSYLRITTMLHLVTAPHLYLFQSWQGS